MLVVKRLKIDKTKLTNQTKGTSDKTVHFIKLWKTTLGVGKTIITT